MVKTVSENIMSSFRYIAFHFSHSLPLPTNQLKGNKNYDYEIKMHCTRTTLSTSSTTETATTTEMDCTYHAFNEFMDK